MPSIEPHFADDGVTPVSPPEPRSAVFWDGTQWRTPRTDVLGYSQDAIGVERLGTDGEDARTIFPRGEGSNLGRLLATASHFYGAGYWVRERANTRVEIVAPGVWAATHWTSLIHNSCLVGIMGFFNVTAVPGVQTVQFEFYANGIYGCSNALMLQMPATAAIGQQGFVLYPGVGAPAHGITTTVSAPCPIEWRCRIVHSGAGNFTYAAYGVMLR